LRELPKSVKDKLWRNKRGKDFKKNENE
jgi:hypothetical protein